MWDDTRVYDISGSVEGSYRDIPDQTIGTAPRKYPRGDQFIKSSSTDIYDTISYGRPQQRQLLNRSILGLGDDPAPTWTHADIGANQGWVSAPFSASNHERVVLGLVQSGSLVETVVGSVATGQSSGSYVKGIRRFHSVYKCSASLDFVGSFPGFSGFSAVSGAQIETNHDVTDPIVIPVQVPDSGRLIDAKVWVEFVHASASGDHPALGSFALALRSPNVSWANGHAHPMRNLNSSEDIDPVTEPPPYEFGASVERFGETPLTMWNNPYAFVVNEFFKNTFLLWEPGAVNRFWRSTWSLQGYYHYDETGSETNPADTAPKLPSWDRDRHMRTVFADGARTLNPRNITSVYHGEKSSVMQLSDGAPSRHFFSSTALGGDRPWFGDPTAEAAHAAAGSPPPGWLNGPGGTALNDEWPTTGSNYGAHEIQPVYPLLEPIFERKLYNENYIGSGGKVTRAKWPEWISPIRPGLRGSEISGTWELLVAFQTGSVPNPATYFRQWRLELIYETNHDRMFNMKTRARKSGCVPARKGTQLLSVVSGSGVIFSEQYFTTASDKVNTADFFINGVFTDYGSELDRGRTIGFISSSISIEAADFAVYSAPTTASFVSSSANRSEIVSILSPSNPLAGQITLSSYVRSKVQNFTAQQSAQIRLSGSS